MDYSKKRINWGYCMDDEELEKISEYAEEIKFRDLLIEISNDKVEREKSEYEWMEERIVELNNLLEEKTDYEIKRDVRYWKGIEKAYSDKLGEYFDKIVRLEKENFLLSCEIDELRDKLEAMENV